MRATIAFNPRCHNILFIRGDGLVRLGGYAWLCRQSDAFQYGFDTRARNDRDVGYFPSEALFEAEWTCAVDVYALGMMIVHFVTSQPPYSEEGNKEAILEAIRNVGAEGRVKKRTSRHRG